MLGVPAKELKLRAEGNSNDGREEKDGLLRQAGRAMTDAEQRECAEPPNDRAKDPESHQPDTERVLSALSASIFEG